jgi:hypothetical protein
MKIPTTNGILTIYGDQEDAHVREYNVGSNQKPIHVVGNSKDTLESKEEEELEELEMKMRLFQDKKKRMQRHEHTKNAKMFMTNWSP